MMQNSVHDHPSSLVPASTRAVPWKGRSPGHTQVRKPARTFFSLAVQAIFANLGGRSPVALSRFPSLVAAHFAKSQEQPTGTPTRGVAHEVRS